MPCHSFPSDACLFKIREIIQIRHIIKIIIVRCTSTRHAAHTTRHAAHTTRHAAHTTRHSRHTAHTTHASWHTTSHTSRHAAHASWHTSRHAAHASWHTAHTTHAWHISHTTSILFFFRLSHSLCLFLLLSLLDLGRSLHRLFLFFDPNFDNFCFGFLHLFSDKFQIFRGTIVIINGLGCR